VRRQTARPPTHTWGAAWLAAAAAAARWTAADSRAVLLQLADTDVETLQTTQPGCSGEDAAAAQLDSEVQPAI